MSDDYRGPVGEHPLEYAPDFRASGHVQGAEGFVQQHHVRFRGQHPGNRDPLRLPAGQLVRPTRGKPFCPDFLQPPHGPLPRRRSGHPLAPHPECHVVQHTQMREQPRLLRHECNPPFVGRNPHRPLIGRHNDDTAVTDPHTSRARGQQARNHSEHRGLAHPVGPDQGNGPSGFNAQLGCGSSLRNDHVGIQPGSSRGPRWSTSCWAEIRMTRDLPVGGFSLSFGGHLRAGDCPGWNRLTRPPEEPVAEPGAAAPSGGRAEAHHEQRNDHE